jgi:hypothetical protein
LAAGREADPDLDTHFANAAALPFGDEAFDLVRAVKG